MFVNGSSRAKIATKKQDRRNLGVPAILTNHNKQTYCVLRRYKKKVEFRKKMKKKGEINEWEGFCVDFQWVAGVVGCKFSDKIPQNGPGGGPF